MHEDEKDPVLKGVWVVFMVLMFGPRKAPTPTKHVIMLEVRGKLL